MSRYINADILLADLISRNFLPAIVKRAIEEAPTADVVEVRHARWFWETGEKRCTNCGVKCPEDEYNYLHPQYCPNCGAKMDGERREK